MKTIDKSKEETARLIAEHAGYAPIIITEADAVKEKISSLAFDVVSRAASPLFALSETIRKRLNRNGR